MKVKIAVKFILLLIASKKNEENRWKLKFLIID